MKIFFELLVSIVQGFFDLLCIVFAVQENDRLYENTQMSGSDRRKTFSRWSKGLVVNGKKRITKKQSLQHVCIVGASGVGKTSSYYTPILLNAKNESFVVIDVDGGMFNNCSGYLQKQGYNIQVLNLNTVEESVFYNPLTSLEKSDDELKSLAETIVKSSEASKGSKDEFWTFSSIHLLSFLLRFQKQLPEVYNTLSNVRYLLTNIETEEFVELVSKYASPELWQEFMSIQSKDSKLRSSIVASLLATIQLFDYSEIAHITSKNTLDFSQLSKPKTILYIITPERKLQRNALLLSILFAEIFEYVQKHPPKNILNILADEASNVQLPSLEVVISVIRRYNTSISLGLQDLSQLKRLYTPEGAKTIINNCSTKIIYPGASYELAQRISNMAGQKTVTIQFEGKQLQQIKPVLQATEIIQMKQNQALFLVSNLPPLIQRMYPYYKQFLLKRRSKIPPIKLQENNFVSPSFIPLFTNPKPQTHEPEEGFSFEEFTD